MKVRLTIFRLSGKYYTGGSYITVKKELFEIHSEIRDRLAGGCLPGLREGHGWKWMILVDVPDHPFNHPKIVMCEAVRKLLNAVAENFREPA